MNKKITITVIFSLLIIIWFSFKFISPKIKELSIKKQIEKANFCSVDSDCIDAGGQCPFNCYNYVNRNEVNRITDLIDSYGKRCFYSCAIIEGATCENNKCALKF